MRRLTLAAALLACPRAARAQQAAGCAGAYQASWETQWRILRAAWDKGCAQGRETDELLRAFQRGFMEQCAARFADAEAADKTSEGIVEAYCAQGVEGEDRLAGRLGVPAAAPPRAAPEASPARKPGLNGMGPLTDSVVEARRKWRPDACLAELVYSCKWMPSIMAGRPAILSERYTYYFWSRSSPQDSFRVAWEDKLDLLGTKVEKPLDGPDSTTAVSVTKGGCLGVPDAGLAQALDGARAAGLVVGSASSFDATLYSPGAWKALGGKRGSPAQQRLTAGKMLWGVAAGHDMAVVDAGDGKGLFLVGR